MHPDRPSRPHKQRELRQRYLLLEWMRLLVVNFTTPRLATPGLLSMMPGTRQECTALGMAAAANGP